MPLPEISLIMLTYNREALVGRAIECALAQTHRDFEFIVVDNGSTDGSGAVADSYASRDGRMRVLHRERGNIGSGRNAGLDAARGRYVAFVDDDDAFAPDFLAFLRDLAAACDADVAICGAADRAFDERRIYSAEEALLELLCRHRYNAAFPTKLFRRDLMDGLRFPETGTFDDIALMYRLLARACRVAYHGLPKYAFTRHPGNTSAWTTDHRLLDEATLAEYLGVYRERTDWLVERFPDSAAAFRYYEWSFMISMVEKIHAHDIPGCDRHLAAMRAELAAHREEFLQGGYSHAAEREWLARYVG